MTGYLDVFLWVVVVNVFTTGLYLGIQGFLRKRYLSKKMVRTVAVLKRYRRSFHGMIIWSHLGNQMNTVKHGVYLVIPRERIRIFYNPMSLRMEPDIWTNNGTGRMAMGASLITIAILIALVI